MNNSLFVQKRGILGNDEIPKHTVEWKCISFEDGKCYVSTMLMHNVTKIRRSLHFKSDTSVLYNCNLDYFKVKCIFVNDFTFHKALQIKINFQCFI